MIVPLSPTHGANVALMTLYVPVNLPPLAVPENVTSIPVVVIEPERVVPVTVVFKVAVEKQGEALKTVLPVAVFPVWVSPKDISPLFTPLLLAHFPSQAPVRLVFEVLVVHPMQTLRIAEHRTSRFNMITPFWY